MYTSYFLCSILTLRCLGSSRVYAFLINTSKEQMMRHNLLFFFQSYLVLHMTWPHLVTSLQPYSLTPVLSSRDHTDIHGLYYLVIWQDFLVKGWVRWSFTSSLWTYIYIYASFLLTSLPFPLIGIGSIFTASWSRSLIKVIKRPSRTNGKRGEI